MSDNYTKGKTYTELPVVEKTEEEKFNDLINVLNSDATYANTDEGTDALRKLTDEQLKELIREVHENQYARPVDLEDLNKDSHVEENVIASVVDAKREYMIRYAVTGVSAAIRQFAHEYSPTPESLTWSVDKQDDLEPFTSDQIVNHMMVQMKAVEELKGAEEHLRKVNAYHAQILEAQDRIRALSADNEELIAFNKDLARKKEIKKILHEISNPRSDSVVVPGNREELEAEYKTLPLTKEDMDAEVAKYDEHITYLRYGITYGQYLQGMEAKKRLPKTREAAYKYEDNKKAAPYPDIRSNTTFTMPVKRGKDIIMDFFNKFFLFNTEEHVRSASVLKPGQKLVIKQDRDKELEEKIANGDLYYLTLAQIRAGTKKPKKMNEDLTYIMSDKRNYNTLVTVGKYFNALRKISENKLTFDQDVITDTNAFVTACTNIMQSPEEYLDYLIPNVGKIFADYENPAMHIPPQDTFHRIHYYMEINHDALKTITDATYPEREEYMSVIGIWKHIVGTKEENKKAFEDFKNRQEDRITSNLYLLPMHNYVTVANTKANRANLSVYNKNSEVLKRLMDRFSEDRKHGEALMAQRIKERKAQNVREHGTPAASLREHENNTLPGAKKYISAVENLKIIKNNSQVPEEVARATEKLRTYEHYESIIKKFGDEDPSTLNPQDLESLEFARNNIAKERELLEIPDDHQQITVFKTNAATGEFSTGKIYTKSE